MSLNKTYRAVNKKLEQDPSRVLRDTRPLSEIAFDVITGSLVYAVIMFFLIATPFIFPASVFVLSPIAVILFTVVHHKYKRAHLPMRMPITSNEKDFGDILPGRRGYSDALGVFYLGQDENGEELWLKSSDVLTHMLVLGTTGAGKTVTLTALASNYLAMGGGFIYTDPKAAPGLWRNFAILARVMGRDDDLRVVNYMTANAPTEKEGAERLTNTLNPFAFGNADMLTQLLNSLIEVSGGDNAVFGQNAMMAVAALMLCLVDLRDKEFLELSVATIRDYFNPTKMIGLALDDRININARDSISAFLTSMGWQADKPPEQQSKAFADQFQYAKAYFGQALNSLTDTYGHIYRHLAGEADILDVIKNRRILINMLPSLEKSPAELTQLGKVTLSSIRNAISVGLGDGIEGKVADVTDSLPLSSPVPFGVLTDEYAAIPTPGFAEVMTQGRGLGISSITGSQDLDGMMGDNPTDKKGAMQIVENTKIKLGMKIAGAGETWNMWKGLADEAYVMQTQGASIGGRNGGQQGGGSAYDISYSDQQSTTVTKVSRVDLRDMQEQTEGEFHSFFNGEVVRGNSFFDPMFDDAKLSNFGLSVIRLLYIPPPNKTRLNAKRGALRDLIDVLSSRCENKQWIEDGPVNPAYIDIVSVFDNATMQDNAERIAVSAALAWIKSGNTGHALVDNLLAAQLEDKAKERSQEINVGTPSKAALFAPTIPGLDVDTEQAGEDDTDQSPTEDVDPLNTLHSKLSWMNENSDTTGTSEELIDEIAETESAISDVSEEKAREIAVNVAKDIVDATAYPTSPKPEVEDNNKVTSRIDAIIGDIL